jgi:uncharacterized heparinase superfamily protein
MSWRAHGPAVAGRLPRLLRTVRYLTPRQALGRLWLSGRFRLYRGLPGIAAVALSKPAAVHPLALATLAGWIACKYPGGPSDRQRQLSDEALIRRFTFLNRSMEFGAGPIDWAPPGASRLWQYHLHYGESVAALALRARQTGEARWANAAWTLVDEWIAGNPPGRRPGWEPYPLSLRIASWATALGALAGAGDGAGHAKRAIQALASQGRFLGRHLEYHLGGNHLIRNARALLIVGALMDGPEGTDWRRRGGALLLSELRRQVLADGGHVERSPLYHGQVLEDALDCLALAAAARPALVLAEEEVQEIRSIADRMAAWLQVMLHPDDGLPLFNDCVVSGEPTPRALLAYAARILSRGAEEVPPTVALPSSGYYVIRNGHGRVVIDCGAVGPDELPAHAHADTLSYELTWGTERVVVDSGTAEYAPDELRRYVRSTAAHNTVRVDDAEQSEVWASHRVGRRAYPLGASLRAGPEAVVFTGAHDGYGWLGVVHHRHVVALADTWLIVDELTGRGRHRFESFVHLHPAFTAERVGVNEWLVQGRDPRLRVVPLGELASDVAAAWYCPDWGQALPASVLRFRGEGLLPLAFGYMLVPAGLGAALALSADRTGITLTGRVDGRPVHVRSERCTSSS